jgi:hypothetical protein
MQPQLCFFVSIAFSFIALGDGHRTVHLAGAPPPTTARSLATSAPAQLPLYWVRGPVTTILAALFDRGFFLITISTSRSSALRKCISRFTENPSNR